MVRDVDISPIISAIISEAPARKWSDIRLERDKLLSESDPILLEDHPKNVNKGAWKVYRQALRDITDQPDPFNISWPTPPQ